MTKNLYLNLYKKMLLIRYAEQILTEHYKQQEIRTPVHFGIGQEAVAVGVCEALEKEDVIFSHHRCHNHYLAKGGNLDQFIAELYGKESGCSKGRGGSVHLTDRSQGIVATSAILGQMIPVAVGAALSFKMDKKANVAVSFFGDGAFDEGVVYESFNYAAINNLPVIFVCENNLYSTETKLNIRIKDATSFIDRARSFRVESFAVNGNNILEVYDAAVEAREHCRKGNGPVFLEFETYRWLEHVGPFYDYELNRTYRLKEEIDIWKEKCPIKLFSSSLKKEGFLSIEEEQALHSFFESEVRNAIARAQSSPWPSIEEITHNVY